MKQKKCLNEKRLTKKQVAELIDMEGKLDTELTAKFKEVFASGYVKQDLVYEISNDRYLFVFDPTESGGGKGDIYSKDYLLKLIKWRERIDEDYKYGRASSIDNWRYYSKHKADIIHHIDELVQELGIKLQMSPTELDKSYKSLDLLSQRVEAYDIDKAREELYDNLVAYIGEVIRVKINGQWAINEEFAGGDYPYIDIGIKNVQYTSVNIVWENLTEINEVNFRKSAANEAWQSGARAKFELQFGEKIAALTKNSKNSN
ncbi:MAG: hypothetical protein RL660_1522 [Bacteroidota bacterium]|jgi:hypothetical protein